MKFHFDANLDYQQAAIEAVCDLFRGQEICRSVFTVTRDVADPQVRMGFAENDLGVGNRLNLLDDELLKNLNEIQIRNGIAPSQRIESDDFTVEMETGTGKTYVYLRTIFELNKRFGFTKFAIVVPSVAIKEGVHASIEMMAEHFRALYDNVPFDYFIYDSAKLGQVRNFATSPNIQIMVLTVGAINKFGDENKAAAEESDEVARHEKTKNVMYRASEKTGGERPIDLVRATRPILIVDEPQSVEGGLDGQGRKAMQQMHPLCKLRYSATPREAHHLVFKLDAVDAYERKLVKQIEVAAATVEGGHNAPFVRLLSVSNRRGMPTAKVELDVQTRTGVTRKEMTVQDGDDLEMATNRAVYRNMRIGEIRAHAGEELLEIKILPGDQRFLRVGDTHGDTVQEPIQRQMIRRTIKEHLDKELLLTSQGIKVLSLFFIDAVEKYRRYDEEGNALPGEYAQIFEEEYTRATKLPEYNTLFKDVDISSGANEVHNGYFSIDKKKVGGKTVEVFRDTRGNTQADEDTYNLIMREKEKLLSFDSKLKFIFSHSALREGWDNPNVFQVCVLREMAGELQRRQSIGRGLRLCRNQQGDRVFGHTVNRLTVIATESYEDFAQNLQREIETETGIRFGIVEAHQFATVLVAQADGSTKPLGMEQSDQLWQHLRVAGYVDSRGKIQDSLRVALKDKTLALPPPFQAQQEQIEAILRKLAGRLEIKNAEERRQVKTRQAILNSEEFTALWERIKHRTTYRVQFDNAKLINECIEGLSEHFDRNPVGRTRLQWHKADITIGKSGVDAAQTSASAPVALEEPELPLPDVLTELQDRTQLTRRSIAKILVESGKLEDFKRNPQEFLEVAAQVIGRVKRLAIVDGIKYQRLGDEYYYAQELFETEELTGYLKNLLEAKKSVHEYVVHDSGVEASFAEQLEKNDAVTVYAKLPGWFKVPTPLGNYNPDWAVLVEREGQERLYLVIETKSSLFTDDLRSREDAKVRCGEAHFEAIKTPVNSARFVKATTLNDILKRG